MSDPSRQRPDVLDDYYAQSASDKLLRASNENPAMPIGIGLGACVFAYMMYSMKTSKQKLSVHLIHTRVLVQGSIVGVLTGMLGYQFYKWVAILFYLELLLWPAKYLNEHILLNEWAGLIFFIYYMKNVSFITLKIVSRVALFFKNAKQASLFITYAGQNT